MEVRPEGGFGLIFTLHAFLPTLSWSPGLLGATPAAPAPPHEGQVDLVGQLGGGFCSQIPPLPSSLWAPASLNANELLTAGISTT